MASQMALPDALKPRPDASSLRELALRSRVRKAMPSRRERSSPVPAAPAVQPAATTEVVNDAMDLDSNDGTGSTALAETEAEQKEDGEMEEGEISDDETQAMPSTSVLTTSLPVPSPYLQLAGQHDMVIDQPPPVSSFHSTAPSPYKVVPALNLAHFGVDEKHVRPGLASMYHAQNTRDMISHINLQ
jgi:hypothetical protein